MLLSSSSAESSEHDDEHVQPSPEDLAGLDERFSRLEDDIDSFSLMLGRLADVRQRGGAIHRQLLLSSSSDRRQYLTSQRASGTVTFSTIGKKMSCAGGRCSASAISGTTWPLLCFVLVAGTVVVVFLQWLRLRKVRNVAVRSIAACGVHFASYYDTPVSRETFEM